MKLTKEQALEKIKELEEFIKDVDNKDVAHNGMVLDKFYDDVFTIDTNFEILSKPRIEQHECDDWDEDYIQNNWNFFDTRENAEKFDNQLIALKKIWKWKMENDGDFVPDWKDEDEEKYNIYYDTSDCHLDVELNCIFKAQPFLPVYSSREIAKRSIIELEKEYKILFDV